MQGKARPSVRLLEHAVADGSEDAEAILSLSNAAESYISFHDMVIARRKQLRARELRQDPWDAVAGGLAAESQRLSAAEHEEMRSHLWGHQAQLRSSRQALPSHGHGTARATATTATTAATARTTEGRGGA